jgi:hypothetical protein
MLASTMIKKLQAQIDAHGDQTVKLGTGRDMIPVKNSVTIKDIDFINGGSKQYSSGVFSSFGYWDDSIRIVVGGG